MMAGLLLATLGVSPLWATQVIGVDQAQNGVTLLEGEQTYTTAFGKGSGKILPLENHLVIFDRSRQQLLWMGFEDVSHREQGAREATTFPSALSLPTLAVPIGDEFPEGGATDVAVWKIRDMSVFILSQKSPTEEGKIAVKTLSFITPMPLPPNEGPGAEAEQAQGFNPPPSPVTVALSGEEETLMGTGPVAVASDPQSGTPLLLSWDESTGLLHEYNISPRGKMDFRGSLKLQGVKDVEMLSPSQSRSDKFDIISEGKRQSFSLLRLHIGRSLQRVELTSAVLNETGNLWTKQLLLWGLMGQVVDFLDRAYGNEWITLEELEANEELNLLPSSPRPQGVKATLEKLVQEGFITQLEYEELERERFLESSRGRRWAYITGSLLVILLFKKHKLKIYNALRGRKGAPPPPQQERLYTRAIEKISSIIAGSLGFIGLSPERAARVSSSVQSAGNSVQKAANKVSSSINRQQTGYRGRLLRRHYNGLLPVRLIKKLEKSLIKITRRLKTPEAEEVLAAVRANRKIKDLKQRSENLVELTQSPRIDDLITQYTDRFVLPSRTLQFRQKLGQRVKDWKRTADEYATRKQALPYRGPRDPRREAAEIAHWTRELRSYFGAQMLRAVKAATLPPTANIQITMDKLKTLERQVEVSLEISRIKGEVLSVLNWAKRGRRPRGIEEKVSRSDEATDVYLNITGREAILSKAQEAQKAAVAMGFSGKYTTIVERMTRSLDELARLDKDISFFTTKGKVWPPFDFWAYKVMPVYNRYFLPEKLFYQSQNPRVRRLADGITKQMRRDYIRLPGKIEPVVVKGEDVRLAFSTGIADIGGDVLSQHRARKDAIDPKERIFGNSPYHIDFTPGEGTGGIHFDLVGSTLLGIKGWALGMPLGYARMRYNHGSSGAITYMDRMKDGIIKGYHYGNIAWGTAQSWPAWWLSKRWVTHDYRKKAGDNYDPDFLNKLEEDLGDRLTSVKSVVERNLYNTVVGALYISPQYYMQQELSRFLPKMLGSRVGWLADKFVSLFVMPYTTGLFYHRWWVDYFGTDNPTMIEILRQFNADGLLDKIDEDGFTDLRTWTLHEVTTLANLVTLFEAHKLEQETPFPEDNVADGARWYANLYARMMNGHPPPTEFGFDEDPEQLSEFLSRVKVGKSEGEESLPFEHEEAAAEFLSRLKQIESRTREYSLAKESQRTVFLRPTPKSPEDILQQNLEAALDDAAMVQERLVETLRVLNENRKDFIQLKRSMNTLAIVDTLILADFLFSGAVTNFVASTPNAVLSWPSKMKKLTTNIRPPINRVMGRFNEWTQKVVRRWGLPAALSSIPLYFWLSKHAEAHGNIQGLHAGLLEELQDILFQLTYELTNAQLALAYDGEVLSAETRTTLGKYQNELEEKEDVLRELLQHTERRSRSLQGRNPLYRAPKVLAKYSPVGIGMGASWLGVRWLLFKGSKGFVPRMVDPFAKGLVKVSALFWFGFSPIANGIEQEILLTSNDFFKLNKAYYQTLMEKNLIQQALEGKSDTINWERDVMEKALQDEVMQETLSYQNELMKLLGSTEGE